MAAITLGLAEVEERLQALRRRLNLATAQHSFYVGSSVLLAIIAVLVFAGLHASPQTFRILAWAALALALSVAIVSPVFLSIPRIMVVSISRISFSVMGHPSPARREVPPKCHRASGRREEAGVRCGICRLWGRGD